MFKKSALFGIALAAASTVPAYATTVNVTPNGSWYEFDIDDVSSASGGLEWIDNVTGPAGYNGDGSELSFTFTVSAPVYLRVVDAGFGGDVFGIKINGGTAVNSSVAVNTYPTSVGTNFDAAWADAEFSRYQAVLGAGNYTVTGFLSTSALINGSPINATIGALSVTPVPVPAAFWLLGSAVAGLAGIARRRSI